MAAHFLPSCAIHNYLNSATSALPRLKSHVLVEILYFSTSHGEIGTCFVKNRINELIDHYNVQTSLPPLACSLSYFIIRLFIVISSDSRNITVQLCSDFSCLQMLRFGNEESGFVELRALVRSIGVIRSGRGRIILLYSILLTSFLFWLYQFSVGNFLLNELIFVVIRSGALHAQIPGLLNEQALLFL